MKNSKRSLALNFVEKNGPSTWIQIQHFLLKLKGIVPSIKTRGYYSSYFNGPGGKDYFGNEIKVGLLRRPTSKDGRWLEKGTDGLYRIKGNI